MEIRQLRYLLTIVETGSFTRAADQLYVSQSALSQQIQVLETDVGTTLIDRSKRGIRLTAAGEILIHHARRVIAEIEQAEIALAELAGVQRGDLHIGVVQTVNSYLMPSIVSAFTSAYPHIRLHIEELAADTIEQQLERDDLQLGIGFDPPTLPGIAAETLFAERLMLVTRDDHPFSAQARVSVSALDDVPMIMLAKTFCTRRLWEENARLAGAQPRVMMEMNTVSSILAGVRRTGMPTVLPQLILSEENTAHLRGIELYDPTPTRQIAMLWAHDRTLCAATQAFMEQVRQATHDLVPVN